MRPPLRDIKEALRRLKGMVAADSEPTLDNDEIMDLLLDHQIGSVWTPNTVVKVGQILVPTIVNGWSYQVAPMRDADGIPGGTTGATEPRWPLDPRWPSWEPVTVDDGTVRFVIHRAEILGLWDLQAAAYAGWMAKANKTAGEYAVSSDSGSMHPEQVHAACVARARQYAPIRIN